MSNPSLFTTNTPAPECRSTGSELTGVRLVRRPLESRRVRARQWAEQAAWPRLIRALAGAVEGRDPEAVAAFRAD